MHFSSVVPFVLQCFDYNGNVHGSSKAFRVRCHHLGGSSIVAFGHKKNNHLGRYLLLLSGSRILGKSANPEIT